MKITSIVRFGVAALAIGAFSGVGLPVEADQVVWVRLSSWIFGGQEGWCRLDLTQTRNLPPLQ